MARTGPGLYWIKFKTNSDSNIIHHSSFKENPGVQKLERPIETHCGKIAVMWVLHSLRVRVRLRVRIMVGVMVKVRLRVRVRVRYRVRVRVITCLGLALRL